MNVLVKYSVLTFSIWLIMSGISFGKQVYLKEGGIIDCKSAWRQGNRIVVNVNRDIVTDFALNEIDLRRTFSNTASQKRIQRREVAVKTAEAPSKPMPAQVATAAKTATKPASQSAPIAAPPAAKPAPQPVPVSAPPAPAAKPAAPLVAAAETAPPPDQAELQRRSQEATKMMAEAIVSKNPELMKKAIEMQKSAIPQQGSAAPVSPVNPLKVLLILLVISLLIIIGMWVLFVRAGQSGWKSLIPIYNTYILMIISGKPGWWVFLLLIPGVNVVVFLLAMLSLAKKFGRNELFGVGMMLLPMIFMPVLAFGGSEYEG